MANEKTLNSRIQLKADTAENWAKATGFIPKKGETIIYLPDENCVYPRYKVGDGETAVTSLPFGGPIGQVSAEIETITENQAITFSLDETNGWFKSTANPFTMPNEFSYSNHLYDKYKVIFDGVEYICYQEVGVVTRFDADGELTSAGTFPLVGNASILGDTPTVNNTSFPFCIASNRESDGAIYVYVKGNTATSHTISVYYIKEENIKLPTELIPDHLKGLIYNQVDGSVVLGLASQARGQFSVSEGMGSASYGAAAHSEGIGTLAKANGTHTEGGYTEATANCAHAEGQGTKAKARASHTEGIGTEAEGEAQHVEGKYNIIDSEGNYVHIIGKGTADNDRSNAHTVDWKGNAWFAGEVTIGEENKTLATSDDVNAVQKDLNNVKNGGAGSYIPTLQMGQEKVGLNFIENGSWVPNPAGNYWSGWSHVEDVIELEDGSTETITTWQLKGMWITGNDYFQILISPQGIFERDLFMNTNTWKREQGKWRKWATSADLANKTSVTIGGEHQKIFDVDTYVDTQTFSLGKGIEKTDLNFNWNSSTKKWDYNPIGNYYGENGGSIEVVSFYNSNMGITESVYFNYWKLIGVKNSDDSCLQILFTEPAIFVRTIGLTSGSQSSWTMPGEDVIQSFVSNKCSEVVQYCDDYLANRYNENWWYADQWFTGNVNISENLTIDKDLIVKGTTYTQDAQTQLIAENIIELNSNKIDNDTALSGLAINKDSSFTYGIMYDPADDTVKLGEGITDSGEFSFNVGEGNPIAIRDDSAEFKSGNFVTFDTDKNKLVDSKQSLSSIKSWVQDLLEMTVAVTTNDDLTKTYTVNAKDSLIGHKITVDGTEEIIIGGTPNGN